MFHQRRQGPDESVDEYAQELRKLFSKAYPPTYHGTPEAELLGKSVLSNQFVAGLEPGLHKKLTGVEGNFEKLVCKARFVEAKWKEASAGRNKNQGDKKSQRSLVRSQRNRRGREVTSAITVVVLSISFAIAHSKGEEHQERQKALRGKLLPTLRIYRLAVKSLTLLKRIIQGEAWQ